LDPLLIASLVGASFLGLYMAWNIGSNDVANSMATAVGAKAITFKQAVIIAGLLNFVGAVFVGSHVTQTIRGNIVNPKTIGDPHILLLGFVSSLIAASIFVTLSTWKEMPISTTHSIIGALLGFGLVANGPSCINWSKVGEVALSWLLSPIAGCLLSFLVLKIITRLIFAREDFIKSAKVVGPIITGTTAMMITSSLFLKTNLGKMLSLTDIPSILGISAIAGLWLGSFSAWRLSKVESKNKRDYETVEMMFRKLQVATSCYVAFSHGANDVANAVGPVAAIFSIVTTGALNPYTEVPIPLLALGGLGIAVGCVTWGHKVMRTLGYRITSLTNTRGFSVDFGAATTVLMASKLGLPISTSHTVVGSVIGVGLARGIDAIDLGVIRKIIMSWLLTLPSAAGLSAAIFILLKSIC